MTIKKKKILIIIPARSGSKGIKNKNIRNFSGKPLLARTIIQAKRLKGADFRIVVSTDSPKFADISKRYGAEVCMRPKEMARDNSLVIDAIIYTLKKMKEDDGYAPHYVMLLQATTPLREDDDIYRCMKKIEEGDSDAVVTVCSTHPLLYNLNQNDGLILINKIKDKKFKKGKTIKGFQRQVFTKFYKLNGCFVYIIKYGTLMKEKTFYPKNTKAVICDAWRSVDLDDNGDFVLAEFLYRHKNQIKRKIKNFK